jgi:hypothetical protein
MISRLNQPVATFSTFYLELNVERTRQRFLRRYSVIVLTSKNFDSCDHNVKRKLQVRILQCTMTVLSLLLFIQSIAGYCSPYTTCIRYLNPLKCLGDDTIENEDVTQPSFLPESGLESSLTFTAERRTLLPSELQVSFRVSKNLRLSALNTWPERELLPWERNIYSVELSRELTSDKGLEHLLQKFRRTILGVEKYRISNPGQIAIHYCEFMLACLNAAEESAWGCAANAIEYAGLNIRKQAVDDGNHSVLDAKALWSHALESLLDISTSSEVKEGVWDQRYFSANTILPEHVVYVQEMLICILRVSIRAMLSRESNDYVIVNVYPATGADN